MPAAELIAMTETLVLLGEDEGIAYFAVALPGQEDELHGRLGSLGEFRDLRDTAALLPAREGALLAHARAMVFWHQTHRHCGRCGSPTRSAEAGHSRICLNEACRRSCYPRTDPAVIVAVSRGERILLGRKPEWPPGRFSTVAGFVEPGETLEEAVAREVKEETGIVSVIEKSLGVIDFWFMAGGKRIHKTVHHYLFRENGGVLAAQESEVDEVAWFPLPEIVDRLAYPDEKKLIARTNAAQEMSAL